VDGLFDVCHGGGKKSKKGADDDGVTGGATLIIITYCMTTSRVCGVRERVYALRYNNNNNNNNNISDYRLRASGEKCHFASVYNVRIHYIILSSYGARDRRETSTQNTATATAAAAADDIPFN